ncbi:acetoin utilization protein AcuC [Luteipulveratus mongoliensis]|uniref:Acetoin utilization protein AcuC n=1 Tax=Luteipulveratus mongoliensis TaxID=571913 RepID=A0A0K1JMR0_9MICO|nr:acetoin utilization protein AcuC [Luteipulveratus mongoliensis]AKU17996.1 acetoin utilization protein AcuC [Luteipulveratus mongoliensis]
MPAGADQPLRTRVVWDPSLTAYNFGPEHPMNPLRLDLTARLARELGVLDAPGVEVVPPALPPEGDAFLEQVHDRDYIDAVRRASADPASADPAYGLGTEDDPAFAGMHESSALIAAGTVDLCRAVWEGEIDHGVNFCGGLHHAMPGSASGFCIYNDAALGIQWMLDHGAERVVYVDVDVHHGDGVERVFWDDPRVLTISLHESGRVLFPGTGFPGEIGGARAMGGAVNVALPPGTGDAPWLRALHAVVPPLVRAFDPQVMVTQQGCDSHYSDPLAHLALSVDAQQTSYALLHRLAHEVAGGRWIALGGGGYEIIDVVPRSWTHLTAIAAHRPIDLRTPVPAAWRDHVTRLVGRPGPPRMGDGVAEDGMVWFRSWETGFDPDDRVDQSVMATREAVFPLHGLDIWLD